MEICKQKNFFIIKVLLPWKWYETLDEILHYKSFSLLPFSITNQTDRKEKRRGKDKREEREKMRESSLFSGKTRKERQRIMHTIFLSNHSIFIICLNRRK